MAKFFIFTFLLGAISGAHASKSTLDAHALIWTGQVEVGGSNIILSGSAEDIYNQIIAINPNYDEELGTANWREISARKFEKRDPVSGNGNCNVGDPADYNTIKSGISYLYGIGDGACGAPAGPGGCSRVSCSNNAGIWLCNDHTTSISVPCRIVADNSNWIADVCQSGSTTHGQIFSIDGTWNVINNHASC